jgi:3-oxoacyl-[acyl-carrier-protein] synthase-1
MTALIVGAGLVCPVGLSLAESAAAARARLARFRESDCLDMSFSPYIVAQLPEEGLPALADALCQWSLQSREARMLRLAHAALADLFATLPADLPAVPLLLGLPEHHTLQPLDAQRFLADLACQAGLCFDAGASIAAPRGRAAGLMALAQAAGRIDRGQAEMMLVGGVDSLLDLYVLESLDRARRIRGETVSDGFTPGEGAAFVLLASEGAAERHGLMPLARVLACGSGVEPGHLYSDEPYLGEGLAAAITATLEAAAMPGPIQTIYCSFNGERYWAREFGVARIRNGEHFADDARMEHPAECCGDLGAAHGVALAALAVDGLAKGYRRGPALVYASSDHGDRAATVLDRTH